MTAVGRAAAPREELRPLLAGAASFLAATYDANAALFPYSTQLVGGEFVNDYSHPQTRRYTINSLLGVAAAARHGLPLPPPLDDAGACVARFVALQAPRLDSPADLGLLLVLLAETGAAAGAQENTLRRVADAAARPSALTMQDLAWMLWGAVATARAGIAEAAPLADSLYRAIRTDFVDPRSGVPRHNVNPLRRHVVSFGGIVYFLRALEEYASYSGDETAERLFRRGVATAIGLQGELGEWPWMIDARNGAPFDLYPVFAVHQDAMAPLFLLPALDRGLPGAERAIGASLAWALGRNQLGERMYVDEPFYAYRSIHRNGRALRARRFLRSLRPRPAAPIDDGRVRINTECRSYHLGWLLYVWAGRSEPTLP